MSKRLGRGLIALATLLVATSGALVTAPSAAAAGPDTFVVTGHGFGHGRGLGQWGARGYADNHGWTTEQILGHFYGGTTAGTRDPGTGLRVLLCDLEGVTICGSGGGLASIIVTSGAPMWIEDGAVTLPGGTAFRARPNGNGWTVEQTPGGCAGALAAGAVWTPVGGGSSVDSDIDIDSSVPDPGDDKTKMLEVCSPKRRTYRGVLDYVIEGNGTPQAPYKSRLVNFLGIDGYLKGVVPSEMPSSWNPAAVRAQAVAARSYALAGDNRFPGVAETCDTTQCQVYLGASGEAAATNTAIAATAGQVRLMPNGTVARTEFSSSTGGHTAGGTFPAVPDLGDAITGNPHHNWSVNLTDDQIEAAFPSVGDVQRIDILERNGLGADGGRVRRLRIVGDRGQADQTGDQFRSRFGLKSDWFTPTAGPGTPGSPTTTAPPGSPPAAQPRVLGWLTRSSATAGPPTGSVAYGAEGYTPISCDWDDDGDDTLGVYINGTWYLRDNLSAGGPTRTFDFGAAGYTPVCGDWDGDGRDSIGVYAAGTWYLRNDVGPGSPHYAFSYGYAGAFPMVGNFDGRDRAVEIAVFDRGSWIIRNDVGPGSPSADFAYGYGGTIPVVGDWNGDGVDGIGVYDNGQWFLRDTATPGGPSRAFAYGYAGTWPIAGHWTPNADGVGIIELR